MDQEQQDREMQDRLAERRVLDERDLAARMDAAAQNGDPPEPAEGAEEQHYSAGERLLLQGLRRAEARDAALGAELEQLQRQAARQQREMIIVAVCIGVIAWRLAKVLPPIEKLAAEAEQ